MGKRPRKKQSPLGKRRRRHEKADGSLANVLGVIREGTARIPILKELVGKLDADDSLALDEAVLRQLNRIAKRLQTQGKETHESLEGLEAQVGEVLEFLRARDDALTPADILRPHALTLGLAKSPAALLHARYQVVPFLEDLRVRELAELDSWCSGEGPTGVRLFVGQGGSGKTRLFVEWASRLRERGWHAGFLPDAPLDADVKVLLSSSEPVFAVLDYAESKPDLCELLRRVTARRARGASPLRIALVAREVADWWTSLIQRDSDVGNLLSQYSPLRLTPVPLEGPLREKAFFQAFAAFAEARGQGATPPEGLDFSDELFGRALYIHMAALAAVEGLSFDARSLLDAIVAHEGRYWGKRYEEEHRLDDLAHVDFERRANRTVAAVTLLGGVSSKQIAEELNRRVGGPGEAHFISFLHQLYPGNEKDGAVYLRPLEPDLLGERLVRRVLLDGETPEDCLVQTFAGAPPEAVGNGLTVLGRVSAGGAWKARPWMSSVIDADVQHRAEPAFHAAMALGQDSAHAELGLALGQALERDGTLEIAAAVEQQLPERTVSLREVAVWATRRLLKSVAEGSDEHAALLSDLGARLSELGRREEALKATQEAVDTYRALAKQKPDALRSDLAGALNNLGTMLSKLDRREQALEAAQEATDTYRALAEQRPDKFLSYLAMSLSNLGNRLRGVGHREEALKAAQEAVEKGRVVAKQRPGTSLPELANSLTCLGNRLSAAGRHEEALGAAQEAVNIYRTLAAQRPDAFLPSLALCLNNLGNTFGNFDRWNEAVKAAREALGIRRALAKQRPDAFLPDVAASLNNLGYALGRLGCGEEALEASQEAVDIYRDLVKQSADAFLPQLATGLDALGSRLGELGRREEALKATQEALGMRRTLAKQRPDVFLRDVASSLNNLGVELSYVGRGKEALEVSLEAADACRALVKQRPDAFLPLLPKSLTNLGNMLGELGRWEEALEAMQEAVDAYRTRATSAFLSDLATCLTNLGGALRKLARMEEALRALQEATAILTELTEALPEAFVPRLQQSFVRLTTCLGETGIAKEEDATWQAAKKVLAEHGGDP